MPRRGFAIIAAGVSLAATSAAGQEIELHYSGWINLYPHHAATVGDIERGFEEKFPDVDWVLNDVPFDQALKQATVASLAGNAPDNIHLIAGWVPALHDIGALEPLNDYFTEEEWAQIPDVSLESVSFDGQIMAMPWVPGPIIMFYNRNLMAAAGLDPDSPPQTWPELIEAAKTVCALPDVDGAPIYGIALRTARNPNSAQWTIPIIYGHGGDVVDEEGNLTFNTDEVAAAYEWVRELTDSGCSPKGFSIDETRNTMAAGRAGFIFEGPWGRGLFTNMSGGEIETAADGDIWAAPMPKNAAGERRTIGNPHEITISSGSEHKELAAEFIRHVIFDPEITEAYFLASSQLSTASMDLLTSGVMGEDAYTQVFVEALPHTVDNPIKSPKFYAVMDDLVVALQSIIQGSDIEQELANAQRKAERTLSR